MNCATILKIILSLVYCAPLNLVNGSVTYSISPVTNGCHVTTIASFSCDVGLSLSESLSSTCQASGNWTRTNITCDQGKKMKKNVLIYIDSVF